MKFEVTRFNPLSGATEERTIVDAATAQELVDNAAVTGDRLYIRPYSTSAA
ncbi:hypothetical protein [Allostreptomyces psammosilenae]|uniref:Uncharacterized protein n=1 Tax=Allostreptomyces psammosilenae TaxID=1892865 RepID=A0A853A0K3_9ACTN|nr:hypothetical protein [Allostreptomyces psammosilenae]NYI08106.1 hypothetical protein [Allostreptomyces psammosilenae]